MQDTTLLDKILVLDFGAQYAHLICRRVRDLGVYAELVPYDITADEIKQKRAKGLVFSGGPTSVYAKQAPLPRKQVYEAGIPILGICYGLQAIVFQKGGALFRGERKEYGRAKLRANNSSPIFAKLPRTLTSWMSHGDAAEKIPEGFSSIGQTSDAPYAAIQSDDKQIFALQFHPEVTHTPLGRKILANYVFNVCGARRNWTAKTMIEDAIDEIQSQVGKSDKVLCALSGGVDSATCALLIEKAIGRDRLRCVMVDHGLLREGERERIEKAFGARLGKNLVVVDESSIFLAALRGVTDPEQKRKIVGREFIHAFERASKQLGHGFKWLAQGTLYSDVVESAKGSASSATRSIIKSHHNVGGLPKDLRFDLLEPLKDLYKDEVRKIAAKLGLPREIVETHPFPGPGLSVRVVGEVTRNKLEIVRMASRIVEEEVRLAGLTSRVWQAYAFTGDDLLTGVKGDARELGRMVTVRIVASKDAMTADWVRLPSNLLEKISSRITNEVPGVTWVSYAISSKPPSTIEPQ